MARAPLIPAPLTAAVTERHQIDNAHPDTQLPTHTPDTLPDTLPDTQLDT